MTLWPARARSVAAVLPAGPPPITATSQVSTTSFMSSACIAGLGRSRRRRSGRLSGGDPPHCRHRIRLRRTLVLAIAFHPREAQCEPAGVARARLQVAECDLDHDLGPDINGGGVAMSLEFEEAAGLPLEHGIGQALEGLAEHHIAARLGVASAEMEVRELAAAAAAAPFSRQHHEVERMSPLDLEPARAAIAGFVGTFERLGHEAFVTGRERGIVEGARLGNGGRDEAGDRELARNSRGECRDALARRPVGKTIAIDS